MHQRTRTKAKAGKGGRARQLVNVVGVVLCCGGVFGENTKLQSFERRACVDIARGIRWLYMQALHKIVLKWINVFRDANVDGG